MKSYYWIGAGKESLKACLYIEVWAATTMKIGLVDHKILTFEHSRPYKDELNLR